MKSYMFRKSVELSYVKSFNRKKKAIVWLNLFIFHKDQILFIRPEGLVAMPSIFLRTISKDFQRKKYFCKHSIDRKM